MKGVVAAILLALAVSCLVVKPGDALNCVDVNLCLTPCIAYLTGQEAAPAPACCQGVTKLKALAATTSDRRLACNCMKQAASHFQNIDDDAVGNLPKKCGTPLPFPINKEVDCSRIP
ncbi:non-specific lipid-transfer protein A-like [Elaeis guineensis]|uniref:non-specific lipid-transfer protein A-like n=1 Tax=Elaeis guineensis var. tenera TaxID=51953 RepID=UPI000579E99C